MTNALIVIDMQNDFCPGGNLAVPHGDQIVAPINKLMEGFGTVILTQDWHPADHTSFADNHDGAAPFDVVQMPYGPQVLWPRHCVIGTPGAAFHRDLDVRRADMVLRKGFRAGIDSYSAFHENDHRTQTGLAGYLRERGITQLSLVGLAHDFCVAWSAIDAAKLGFETRVIEDACRAIDMDGSLATARTAMRDAGVALV
ncbi:bifunctional nicotinamidase/pyrazinamidase [Paracoccus sp. R86501]|uniref:bifunctional nicotinamidase/pyrazinamidase n=1 Tax=Paracoccus sp. R86501 TaxID=3101711 RepID=UPI00366E9196